MNTKAVSDYRVQLALGCAILALVVVGAISYRGIVVSGESDRWVRHTHEVLDQLHDLEFAMQGVESSYRGFVLTGKESYIESYRSSIESATQAETTVGNLTVDNPAQQRQLPGLQELMAEKIKFGESVIGLRQRLGLDAAADVIQNGPGQQIMDQFDQVIRQMQDEELRLLALRRADAKRRLAQTKILLAVGTILGVLIAVAAVWSVRRDSFGRGLTEEALRDSEGKQRRLL